jgi:hypothetical protein
MRWAVALALAALGANTALARNVALLIGVGQFVDPLLSSEQLLGPEADLDSMQRTLIERWHFLPADLRTLRDREATHERILAEISALAERSARGDTVLIYFSGHGTSASADNNSYDLPYATGAWVPYDVDINTLTSARRTLIIGRRDLVPRLKQLDAGGRAVVVVSDSCFSGQVVRSFGQTHSRLRFLNLVTRDLGVARVNAPASSAPSVRPPPPPYPYQHVLLLSAASDSEAGADISTPLALQQAPTLDGKYHGAFTDAFLRLLSGQLLPGSFNYAQAQAALSAFLEHRHFAQHPQLLPAVAEDPQNVGASPFLGAALAGAPAPTPPSLRSSAVRVRLESVSSTLKAKIAAIAGVELVTEGADLVVRQRSGRAILLGPAEDPILTTTPDDPAVPNRIAAQVWLKGAVPTGVDRLGLRAETDPGSRGNTYVECESFVFEVRLQKPAYLMVLDLNSQGELTVLYPTNAAERQLIAPGKPRAIPDADPHHRILVLPPFGTDEVAVLAFERMPEFFQQLTDAQRFDTHSARAASLARGLVSAAGSAMSVQQMAVYTYPGRTGAFCAH